MTFHSLLRPLALAAALGLSAPATVLAAEYSSLDTAASSLTFGYSQMNVKMDGKFGELKATELSLDQAKPEEAKVTIEVALSSIYLCYSEDNTEIEKVECFALSAHILATITAQMCELY